MGSKKSLWDEVFPDDTEKERREKWYRAYEIDWFRAKHDNDKAAMVKAIIAMEGCANEEQKRNIVYYCKKEAVKLGCNFEEKKEDGKK